MRQLMIHVPSGEGRAVLDMAREHRGENLARIEAEGDDGALDLVTVNMANDRVEAFLAAVQAQVGEGVRVTLVPRGMMVLKPPAEEAPEQVTDVGHLSPLEVFLGGLQSVGSWRGFLGYAAAAGAVVWVGLYTNTIYLLTAAMLIAPFASPAMVLAMATARGDRLLLGRSLLRYFSALALAVAVAGVLSLVAGQDIATRTMVDVSTISAAAVVLPLVAGSAGALNLCLSERNSLVSGAATGMLVAASLSPPAGVIGMSAVVGDWQMAKSGVFIILLQLIGINVAGAAVFRMFGLTPRGARYTRGRSWAAGTAWSVTAVLLAAMLFWQFHDAPDLQRDSKAKQAEALIREAVSSSGLASVVRAEAEFTRADIPGQNSLLATVHIQAQQGEGMPDDRIRAAVAQAVGDRLARDLQDVTPLVDVTVLHPPGVQDSARLP